MIGIKINNNGLVCFINHRYDGKGNLIVIESIQKPEIREGYGATLYYENGTLVYHYHEIPTLELEQIISNTTQNEQIDELIRQKYSANEEFAIIRQRDHKTEEFLAYFNYAEECKTKVKNITQTNE